MLLHRLQREGLPLWRRLGAGMVTVWVLLSMSILALPPESLAVCMMACSLDDNFCCCKAFGHRKPFSATGEASYLSSHLPSAPKDLCNLWGVMKDGTTLEVPSPGDFTKVVERPRPRLVQEPLAEIAEASVSAPALPRPPPHRF